MNHLAVVDYIAGLDLGQAADFTALAVLERRYAPDPREPARDLAHYDLRQLRRWPLGTPYTTVARDARELFAVPPLAGSTLAVDRTGVGAPVVEMLRQAQINGQLVPIHITGGQHARRDEESRGWTVPKVELVSALQVAFQARRLRIARGLREAGTLVRELQDFRVRITAAAHETFGAREGQHDDLVLAVAMAVWLSERSPRFRWQVTEDRDSLSFFHPSRVPRGVFLDDGEDEGGGGINWDRAY
jgi:hypothetical protein